MRMALIGFAALVLSSCCGEGQCNGVDGEACTSGFDCSGACVDGFCRDRCSQNTPCGAGRTCWDDGTTTSPVCLPPPSGGERWSLRADGLFNATGRPGEITEPDDFVCFVVAGISMCSQEETGLDVTFDRSFSTVFTTDDLADVSVSVFDSNQVFSFGGCEGNCSSLESIDRQLVHGEAVDARPLASRREKVWDITTSAGMTIRFSVLPR